jgi:hypothetical protein
VIDEPVLIEAARGHISSLATADGAEAIDAALKAQRVVPDDFRSCIAALWETRTESGAIPGSPRAAYMGGAIDGFLLGVKAARGEHGPGGVLESPEWMRPSPN